MNPNVPEHLQSEIESQESYDDGSVSYTITSLKDQEDKIWTFDKLPPADLSIAAQRGALRHCATTEIRKQLHRVTRMPSDNKLKWRSKYLAGSCVVYVAFINGPTVNFKGKPGVEATRIQNFLAAIAGSLRDINALTRNDKQAFPKISFTTVCDNTAHDTDVDVPPGIEVVRNIKQFLRNKKYFSGAIDTLQTPEYLQAAQNFINDKRDSYNADWGILLVCNASTNRCWADASPFGFAYLSEGMPYKSQTILHEILHLFGASDEYHPPADCDPSPYGWYDAKNSNCATPEGNLNCMMGNFTEGTFTGLGKICKATAEQLSLVGYNGSTFQPQRDKIVHVYNLKDAALKSNVGTWLNGDQIRLGGSVEVSVTGLTKMNPFYNPHGPEGDVKTIVGSDHLLPNQPFSCVIGRWRSFTGSQVSPWFKVGSGGTFKAPFTGFFTVAVNDKKDGFGDNSGYLDVTLKSLLRDNYGAPFVYATTRGNDNGMNPSGYHLESE